MPGGPALVVATDNAFRCRDRQCLRSCGCLITAAVAEAKTAHYDIGFLSVEYYSHFKMAEMYVLLIFLLLISMHAGGADYWLTRIAGPAR